MYICIHSCRAISNAVNKDQVLVPAVLYLPKYFDSGASYLQIPWRLDPKPAVPTPQPQPISPNTEPPSPKSEPHTPSPTPQTRIPAERLR